MQSFFEHLTASDWVEVLAVHLQRNCRPATQKEMCVWLKENGYEIKAPILSSFKNGQSRVDKIKPKIIEIIRENVELADCFTTMEIMSFKALNFFSWGGNPLYMPKADRLDGIYQCKRFSFAEPGMITKSLMMFYQLEESSESPVFFGLIDPSKIFRFREFRKINTPKKNYIIHTHGFWFHDRGGILLFGMSVETTSEKTFSQLEVEDIDRMYTERLDLINDHDNNNAYGHYHTIIKNGSIPATAFIDLRKNSEYSATTDGWEQALKEMEIGVFSPSPSDSKLLYQKKRFNNKYKMLMAGSPIEGD